MSISLGMSGTEAYSSSKIAIIRDARGLVAIWGIWRNSSRSIEPDPSLRANQIIEHGERVHQESSMHLSSFMKRFFNRSNSGCVTVQVNPSLIPYHVVEVENIGLQLERLSISSMNCDADDSHSIDCIDRLSVRTHGTVPFCCYRKANFFSFISNLLSPDLRLVKKI